MKKASYFLTTLLLFVLHSPLFAQENSPPARDQGMMQTFIMIGIFLVFFYFILFRPEQKRRKAAEELRTKLKKGDKVTAMGIIGTVSNIKEQTVILRMVDGSKIEVVKGAISEVIPGTEEDIKKAEKEE